MSSFFVLEYFACCCRVLYLDHALLNLAKQVVEQAEFLWLNGEDLQLTADQALQLEKMAALEKSSREQSEKVRLLEAHIEAL